MERWIAIAVVVVACGKADDKGQVGSESWKVKTAKLEVQGFAFSAYTQWLGDQAGKQCPDSLSDLTPFMDRTDTKDPWGSELAMKCEPSARGRGYELRVISAGPDGKMGTDDDLDSSKLKPE